MNYLSDILEVNNITLQELKTITKTKIKPTKGGKFPRQKFILSIVQAGLKVPYHLRPICSCCGIHFLPTLFHQQRCQHCSHRTSPYIDLTPEDCKELDMSWTEANVYLQEPESYRAMYEGK